MVSFRIRVGLESLLIISLLQRYVVADEKAIPPPPVGSAEAEANLTIWFVDGQRVAATWGKRDAFQHKELLALLGAAGLRPRVEHMAQAEFPARWKEAEELHRLPDLLSATHWLGAVRSLDQEEKFRPVVSERLSSLIANASCRDFAGRFLWIVRNSEHPANVANAAERLLRPGSEFQLPGPRLDAQAGRLEAEQTARRAATAFLSGDPAGIRAVASRRSSQLAECTRPGPLIKETKALAREVALRGNDMLAVAVVETSFEGKHFVGADPVVVVLVREDKHWKALCVCRDIMTLTDAVPSLCKAMAHKEPSKLAPPEPKLLGRRDGQILSRDFPFLTWTVPAESGPVLAQIFEHHFGDSAAPEESWPQARLEAFPGEARNGKANPFAGVIGSRMSWTVWTIGPGGQVAVAPAVHFEVR